MEETCCILLDDDRWVTVVCLVIPACAKVIPGIETNYVLMLMNELLCKYRLFLPAGLKNEDP